jgi:hypothetical protein
MRERLNHHKTGAGPLNIRHATSLAEARPNH